MTSRVMFVIGAFLFTLALLTHAKFDRQSHPLLPNEVSLPADFLEGIAQQLTPWELLPCSQCEAVGGYRHCRECYGAGWSVEQSVVPVADRETPVDMVTLAVQPRRSSLMGRHFLNPPPPTLVSRGELFDYSDAKPWTLWVRDELSRLSKENQELRLRILALEGVAVAGFPK